LPPFPRRIGIVTSARAAALSDILTTLKRRAPTVGVVIYPAMVQGDGAAADIARSIATANARAEVDVLIVARGGGSIEDLWAFNEELVARAIYQSVLPVVSGVGHETDFTISDFVADVRAPTPTGAATLVVPDRRALLGDVAAIARRWRRASRHSMDARQQRIDGLSRRLLHPAANLARQRREAQALAFRLARAHRSRMADATQEVREHCRSLAWLLRKPFPQAARVAALGGALQRAGTAKIAHGRIDVDALQRALVHLNPRAVLDRGYAIVSTGQGNIVYDAAALNVGDDVEVAFARGTAGAKIVRRE
jgi:exodeoxyribonuclease VII large subunit